MKIQLGLFIISIINVISVLTSSEVSDNPGQCTSLCTCFKKNGNFRVRCEDSSLKLTSLLDFGLHELPPNTVHLNLSDNGITALPRAAFGHLTSLEKLELRNNRIKIIEPHAFYNLSGLKRLDLSGNKISKLNGSMIEDLQALERLKVSENNISRISPGTFNVLPKLKYLNLTGNPFICDCHLQWLSELMKNESKLKIISPLKCKSPEALRDKPIKKLALQEMTCIQAESVGKVNETEKVVKIELRPSADQVVFEGDSLLLWCQVWVSGRANVWWTWDGSTDLSSKFHHDVSVETHPIPEKGQVEVSLNIDSLLKEHAGRWDCNAEAGHRNLSSSISILVISNDTRYCPETVTSTNKGLYLWPQTIVGTTVELPCAGESSVMEVGPITKAKFPLTVASHHCSEEGIWEGLNTTGCVYLSDTTKALEQFAKMNLSLTNTEVLESAQRLLNFTADGKNLQDMMDIVFISKTVENYLAFIGQEKELCPVLVDLVGVTSKLPSSLLTSAQLEDGACNRLVEAVESVAINYSHSFSKPEMAVEKIQVKRETYLGITCTWYSKTGASGKISRLFYCSPSNKSSIVSTPDKIIEASIQVPSTLFYQLELQGYQLPPTPPQIMASAFENSRLFPRILTNTMKHNDGKEITSCVVGSKLVGIEVRNLTDPVYVMIRAPVDAAGDPADDGDEGHSGTSGGGRGSWLVRWDREMNDGLGGWSEDGCHLSHFLTADSLLVFHCDSLGHFALLRDIPAKAGKSRRWGGMGFHFSHPAVYAGSFIGFFSMLIAISTYVIFHASIRMSRKAKHSLVNTWLALCLLLMVFSLGIRQTGHFRLCQVVGLLLHYLILSALLWMVVTLSNMYKKLTKSDSFDAHDDEPPPDHPPKKPMLGFYLVGWGIALIICGISAAVNKRSYAGQQYCFLSPNPSISAIYVPAAGILFLIFIFSLLIYCITSGNHSDSSGQFSVGTRATENIDLEMEETSRTVENRTAPPAPSVTPLNTAILRRVDEDSEENDDDLEHSPHAQLGSHMALLLLFLLVWAFASLTTMPFYSPPFLQAHGEAVFGVLYGIFSSALGIFILVFYCVLRCDVRNCWEACWNGGEILVGPASRTRGGRCCRSRSVSDAGAVKPVGNIDCSAKQNGVVSVSQCPKSMGNMPGGMVPTYQVSEAAARTVHHSGTDDSTKSLRLAGALPGPQLPPPSVPFPPQGVAAHDSSTSGPDISVFYNPHQMGVARKFFRRQRQMRHGRRGMSGSDTASPPSVARRRRVMAAGTSDADRGPNQAHNHASPVKEKDASASSRASPVRPSRNPSERASTSKSGEDAPVELPSERFVIGAEDDQNGVCTVNCSSPIEEKTECSEVSVLEMRVCGNGEESCSSPGIIAGLAAREVPGAVASENPDSKTGSGARLTGNQFSSSFEVDDVPAECTSSDSGCKTENRDEEAKHGSDSPVEGRMHMPFYGCSGGESKEMERHSTMPIRGSSDSEVEAPCVRNGNRVFDISGDFRSLGRTRKKHFAGDCHGDRCLPDFMYITPEYMDVPRVSISEKSELLPESKLSEGNSELDSFNSEEEILLEDSNVMKKETSV
ncbi:adhesion G protein-coupled receptor A3 [Ischnura elegans]|uniref:adhesion G protein-coupled receptor A3 n=1 Tax=Ischnura elegans TaxID=197161 RepID=UPI001ED885B3|nr:adhesion G protein-coupled receptor A3 [Ischnura elegans]XP_046386029.1 adhesion G protein-coupled receptor A3 [Ischnura elegans]XP_046386030.1 adhesion G protein-coupled receptor A3 [Ischnura elegans]XP_046386032.1 adhesion G protein-coupled receptor A3 [Ischnura elegans]